MLLQVIDTVSLGTYTTTSSKDLPMLSSLDCGHSQHCKSIIYLVLFTLLIVVLVVPGYLRLYNIIVGQKTMVFHYSTHEKLVISQIKIIISFDAFFPIHRLAKSLYISQPRPIIAYYFNLFLKYRHLRANGIVESKITTNTFDDLVNLKTL